jgi:zinc transport system substrate-binding protein
MRIIILIVTAILLVACTDNEPAGIDSTSSQGKPVVMTSNYPLNFFTHEIAGENIEVSFPTIEGDPAMWAPSGEDASKLQNADLLILNGAGYETWLAFTTLPDGLILDTTANMQDMLLPIENETVHQHGPAGKHSHQGTAFTTWLDPQLAIEQARAIMQGLSRLAPEQSELFNLNFEILKQRLLQLDQSLAQAFADLGPQPVIFSHPVYQYLQNRYGINGRSMHWEPDTEPGTRDWIDFGNLLREHPARLMIWEASPSDSVRGKLDQMGVQSVVFNPAGNQPDQGDYFLIMEESLRRLKALVNRIEE